MRGIAAVGAARAEFEYRPARRFVHDARRFGGDARLVVEGEQQVGFDQLAVNQRRAHGEQRFVREDDRAFRHGADVATEAEVGEVVEEFGGEDAFAAQKGDVVRGEVEEFEVVQHLCQPGEDGVAAVVGHGAEEVVEVGDFMLSPLAEVALRHGERVVVHQQDAMVGRCLFHSSLPLGLCVSISSPWMTVPSSRVAVTSLSGGVSCS